MNKEEWIAFLRRALWTFAQAFCAVLITKIPEGSAFNQVGWMDILQVAFVAGILSVAKSFLVGVPEAGSYDGTLNIDSENPRLWQFDFNDDPIAFSNKKTITFEVKSTDLKKEDHHE